MSGINDRIKSKLDRNKGITQADIARYCGVSTSAVSQWIAGGGIDNKHIPKIAKFLEVSQKWLLTGEEGIQTYCSGEEDPPEGVIAVPEYELGSPLVVMEQMNQNGKLFMPADRFVAIRNRPSRWLCSNS